MRTTPRKRSRLFTSAAAALSLVALSACVTDPNTGERKVSRTAIGGVGGAGLGYLLGSVIGGKTARIVGAGIGGVAGGGVGYQNDRTSDVWGRGGYVRGDLGGPRFI